MCFALVSTAIRQRMPLHGNVMFKRIRSALFIDFENMPLARDSIASWLAWLEDGGFDGNRRRKFLLKRVYWNSGVQKFKSAYEASGFEVMLCDRYHGLANSVDVQMAIDIIEQTYENPRIDEYILITRDTDFVPVLKRLREKQKRTVFMVNEAKLNVHTTYSQHADILIPVRALDEARRYERGRRGLFARLGLARRPRPAAGQPSRKPDRRGETRSQVTSPDVSPLPDKPIVTAPPRTRKPAVRFDLPTPDVTNRALECALQLASAQPDRPTSRARMIAALQVMPEFATSGRTPFLGYGDYRVLMQELARLDPRLQIVDQPGGGMVVRFAAPLEPVTQPGAGKLARPTDTPAVSASPQTVV
jgi:uncharacterized protein (TIGR00288 family)